MFGVLNAFYYRKILYGRLCKCLRVFVIFIRTDELSRWLRESTCNAGNAVLIHGSGRSPGEGNGYPFQCSCLEKSIDKEPGGLQSWGCKVSDTTEQLN